MRKDALPDPCLGWQFSTCGQAPGGAAAAGVLGARRAVATKPMAPTNRSHLTHDNVLIMREIRGINREHEPPDSPEEPDPPAQLAAVIPPGAVALAADPVSLVPALIAAAPSPPFSVQLAAVMANVGARHQPRANQREKRRRDARAKRICFPLRGQPA
jgi:hypothetical protein